MWTRALASLLAAGIALAWAVPPPRPDPPFVWPTGDPAEVLAPFAPPAVPWGSGHRGVDLALGPGDAVVAAGDGTVVYAGELAGRGVVSIEHSGGLRTTYEPVTAAVARGDDVAAGQVIGTLQEGHCEESCLHLGARRGEHDYIDPLSLFAALRVRLYPVRRPTT